MNRRNTYFLILAVVLAVFAARADVLRPVPLKIESGDARFKINSSVVDVSPELEKLVNTVDSLSRAGTLQTVVVVGSSSPDGPTALNERLAKRRAQAVARYIIDNSAVKESDVQVSSIGEDLEGLRRLISESSGPGQEAVLAIVQEPSFGDKDEIRIKRIEGRKAWKWLADEIFPRLRTAVITVTAEDVQIVHNAADGTSQTFPELKKPLIEEAKVVSPYIEYAEEAITDSVYIEPTEAADDYWTRHLYIKTNLPAWLMLWTNIAVEVDIAPHWSATLPVYYSGFNYFKHTLKWRTLTLQPEFRYWFRGDNTGPFIGAHFSAAWYNVAFDERYRYQDHNRRTPALGGGIAVGWRFNICRDPRWQMEATIGGGIYKLDYDLFQNRYNGLLVGRRQRTFFGIDQAALSISYRFDVGQKTKSKKGGDQ